MFDNGINIPELAERIASTKRLLDSGSLCRCSRAVAMAQEDIRLCEEEIQRQIGELANVH